MKLTYPLPPLLGLILCLSSSACSDDGAEPADRPAIEQATRAPLDEPNEVPRLTQSLAERLAAESVQYGSLLDELYGVRHYQPVWVTIEDDRYVLSEKGNAAVKLLDQASEAHALDEGFAVAVDLGDQERATATEIAISRQYVELAHSLGLPARLGDENDESEAAPHQLVDALQPAWERALSAEQLESLIAPPYEQYDRLLEVYLRYREIAHDGDFPRLPPSLVGLTPQALTAQFAELPSRLAAEGFWKDTDGDFGVDLVASLRAFQRAHRLEETGWVDEETREALNVSAKSKVQRIERALEQWRQSPIGGDRHYVWVNIPDYHAEVWRDGERKMRFKVIVGAGEAVYDPGLGRSIEQGETPRFSDEIELIEFNPYWWIPDSIVENEYAPRQARDPSFYARNDFEWGKTIYGATRLRQRPGPNNALGQVKFLFPNDDAIYLHDTNKRELFAEKERNLSHGCVRIENPFDFARYLMIADGQATHDDVDEFIDMFRDKREPSTVVLSTPLPIHIGYVTTRVGDDGHVRFLPDPYDLEAELAARD